MNGFVNEYTEWQGEDHNAKGGANKPIKQTLSDGGRVHTSAMRSAMDLLTAKLPSVAFSRTLSSLGACSCSCIAAVIAAAWSTPGAATEGACSRAWPSSSMSAQ